MSTMDDETLQVYIEESVEHLADIENDLLSIEEAGANIDEDLVNKVYRAAHSIKGGAGFMGLTKIKDLTHEMENILGQIRSREMVPNTEIVNILLLAADTLRDLINDVGSSNDADISSHVEALKALNDGGSNKGGTEKKEHIEVKKKEVEDSAPEQEIPEVEASNEEPETVYISFPDREITFILEKDDVTTAFDEGKGIYMVAMDLIEDIQAKNKKLISFINEVESTGIIMACKIDTEAVGFLEQNDLPDKIPMAVIFSTILKPNDINMVFEIEENNIFIVGEDLTVTPLVPPEEIQVESAAEKVRPEKKDTQPKKSKPPKEKPKTDPSKKTEQIMPVSSTPDTSLRVHVSLLDNLMTLAGELVLGRNQLLQAITSEDKRASEIACQRVDLITSELQEAIMLTRMQPIGNVFNKFPRVVRDLARALNKDVELALEGKDVELDKTIIEAISDPLTHLVRNAVDHGVEIPEDRRKRGKNPTGSIYLKAYHAAGQVNIEISDDGKGLDGEKLASAAVSKGLITDEQVRVMSSKEKINLIFLPGFSTAKEISDVSGRGVGMDVVKTNLDKLGGQTEIESKLGMGTTIRIKLPLTLAIIPSQIILTGGERYAIPQVNLEELLRIPANQVKNRIERVGDAEVVRLRGKLLPLVRLADIIGVQSYYYDPNEKKMKIDRRKNIADRRSKNSPMFKDKSDEENKESNPEQEFVQREDRDRRYHAQSALNVVVVSTGAMRYGLVVDQLYDSEEIVVKPLGRDLKNCKGYAGATIMGDGRVALILDVGNLAQMAGLTSIDGTDRAAEITKQMEEEAVAKKEMQALLLFRSSEEEQFSVPLNQVERIEKINTSVIEEVGGKKVMQYRGGSLALFTVDQVANVKSLASVDNLLVIVFTIVDREIGILAIGPVDAVETSAEMDDSTLRQPGIIGSTIVGDKTTQLVDVYGLVKTLNPEWFVEKKAVKEVDGSAPTILYAEDSNFFRNQVTNFMKDEGYEVIEAEDGIIAWDLLQKHANEISLVVTDIEMPNLDGFGFSRKIRGDDRFSDLPIIAVTTLAGEENEAKGKEVGINDYQIKLDREKLLNSIKRTLKK